jgi:hypothetical protein
MQQVGNLIRCSLTTRFGDPASFIYFVNYSPYQKLFDINFINLEELEFRSCGKFLHDDQLRKLAVTNPNFIESKVVYEL